MQLTRVPRARARASAHARGARLARHRKYLCLPSWPWKKGGVAPPKFLGKDAKLPMFVAIAMGLQHALAMVAGIATSGGRLIAGDACFAWQKDSDMCAANA